MMADKSPILLQNPGSALSPHRGKGSKIMPSGGIEWSRISSNVSCDQKSSVIFSFMKKICHFRQIAFVVGYAFVAILIATASSRSDGILKVGETRIEINASTDPDVVFDSERDGCDADDIPDVPMRFLRRADGQIIGFGSHFTTRIFMVTKSADMKRDCSIVMRSEMNPNPSRFSDMTWLSTVWSRNGKLIYAFSDNEYHGHKHKGECLYNTYQQCWFNTIVIAVSEDGGRSFSVPERNIPIAASNFNHKAHQGEPRGFFTPTNLIKKGEYYYSIIFTTGGNEQQRGQCLFRTRDPGTTSAWQYWTGAEFIASAHNPMSGSRRAEPCQPLSIGAERVQSLVLHKSSGLFLLTGVRRATHEGGAGVYFFASRDLINWSKGVLAVRASTRQKLDCDSGVLLTYPAILDVNSSDRNFSSVGDDALLFATRVKLDYTAKGCVSQKNRQLVRYRVHLRML